MPAMYQIAFAPEGRTERFFGSRGNYYELEEGSHLDVYTTPVWCHHCASVTHGEDIWSLELLDQRLADLANPQSQEYQMLMTPLVPDLNLEFESPHNLEQRRLERVEEVRKRRSWRERRSSPPRCIHCGSTEIIVLPFGEPVPNPAGPGTITVSITGMCSTNFNEWYFTPEGERIPRDTKPTYWHHPAFEDDRSMLKKLLPKLFRPDADSGERGSQHR